MSLVFIGLGSNLGSGRQNIKKAWQLLGQLEQTTILTLSSPFLSEPVGMESEHWFTNAVGVLECKLSPHQLLDAMLAIENKMGRDRQQGKDRTIDLDILYYDDMIIKEAELVIPHPEITNRLFVLAPLLEVAPDHLHPVAQQSSSAMKRNLASPFQVEKSSWE